MALRHSIPLNEADYPELRLRRQWLLTDDPNSPQHSWSSLQLGQDFTLHAHPEARLRVASSGEACLAVVGPAVLSAGDERELQADLQHHAQQGAASLEPLLQRLCGTYAMFYTDGRHPLVFTDPAGMMNVFYGQGRAASTPALFSPLRRDTELDRDFTFGPDNDWYPGGLTPFEGIRVLPANHCLDLATWTCTRFWPRAEPARRSSAVSLDQVAQIARNVIAGASELGPLAVSLTGGRDSRVNLAAVGRTYVERDIEFFTLRGAGVKRCDIELAGDLARRFDLPHTFVDVEEPAPWLLRLYDDMTAGLSIGGRRNIVAGASKVAGPSYIHVNGNLGALAKSFYWHTRNPRTVHRRTLAKEFLDRPPAIRRELDGWLDDLPANLSAPTIYNLMYLEQRGGRWMGIGETASALFYDSLSPLCSREIFELLSGLPTQEQYGGGLLARLVENMWPELLAVPYCKARRNWSTFVPRRVKTMAKAVIKGG